MLRLIYRPYTLTSLYHTERPMFGISMKRMSACQTHQVRTTEHREKPYNSDIITQSIKPGTFFHAVKVVKVIRMRHKSHKRRNCPNKLHREYAQVLKLVSQKGHRSHKSSFVAFIAQHRSTGPPILF